MALLLSCGGGKESVPDISLVADGEVQWEDWMEATLKADGTPMECKVHYRGGGSSRYDKHSYAVKFPERVSLLGMPADKDWILNATFIDKTFLRHKLSYDIFRQMHPDNRASQCAYARLYEKDLFRGLYVVMQKLDASTLGIVKEDSSSVIFKEPPFLYAQPIVPQDSDNYYQQAYPKKRKEDRTAQVEALRWLVFEAPDSLFAQRVGECFDLRNVADWHILLLLTNNSDGILKNFYLYKVDDKTPFRIAPWDYDHSFGRDSDGEYNMLSVNADINRNLLLKRLMRMDEYRHLVASRWQQLRDGDAISVERLTAMIDADADYIREAARQNAEVWPVDDPYFYDGMDFDEELDVMRTFVRLNVPRLDHYFSHLNTKINRKKIK